MWAAWKLWATGMETGGPNGRRRLYNRSHTLPEDCMRTSNPALKDQYFKRDAALAGEGVMTLQGTAAKSFLLVLLAVFSAAFTWREYLANPGILMPAIL